MADPSILSKESLKQQLRAMNLPISRNKETLLERNMNAVTDMKNSCGSPGVPLFVTSSAENPVLDLNLPIYDLHDNLLLVPFKMEEAMKNKVQEAVEAQYPNFSGLEMPVEATAAIDIFVRQILDGVLNNFQDCLEESIKDQGKPLQYSSGNTPIPIVPTVHPACIPTFVSITAWKPQTPNSEVPRKVRPAIMQGTQQTDEKTVKANPTQPRGPPTPRRDFAIRGFPKHITAEQLSAYLQGTGRHRSEASLRQVSSCPPRRHQVFCSRTRTHRSLRQRREPSPESGELVDQYKHCSLEVRMRTCSHY
ncbi:hypothetical protein RvY_14455 [Ramazzottius varieornatus]|uniref:SAP domain-containing protein n=1 Tax=Ramazzottius varieornatus TaxID=947166 RepID=A0A1D1VWF3_RAMVA|nr:hypothetical protein RvY_14455 [Ramazzottius varieornatus]